MIGDSKVRISVEGTQDHEEYLPSVSLRTGRSLMMPIGSLDVESQALADIALEFA
jgi:hypothetical protein